MNINDQPQKTLDDVVDAIIDSYRIDERTRHLDSTFLPSRLRTIEIIELFRRLIFPGFFEHQRLTSETVRFHVGEMLYQLRSRLFEQVREALRYEHNVTAGQGAVCEECDHRSHQITDAMLEGIPEIRRILGLDVQAAFDGDPAAVSTDETIFCYPGVDAIFIYRIAHVIWNMKVPLLARIMSEYAHNETGIDIHPGATIGESFFIDHGTGVVIGETSLIGKRVKIYQGVTLGALSTKGGQAWRGRKRHPTIEDDVTIYPNATILGGETVVGHGSVINGSVFLYQSVPPHTVVRVNHPQLEFRTRKKKGRDGDDDLATDFQI